MFQGPKVHSPSPFAAGLPRSLFFSTLCISQDFKKPLSAPQVYSQDVMWLFLIRAKYDPQRKIIFQTHEQGCSTTFWSGEFLGDLNCPGVTKAPMSSLVSWGYAQSKRVFGADGLCDVASAWMSGLIISEQSISLHCNEMTITLTVSGFNAMADQCKDWKQKYTKAAHQHVDNSLQLWRGVYLVKSGQKLE